MKRPTLYSRSPTAARPGAAPAASPIPGARVAPAAHSSVSAPAAASATATTRGAAPASASVAASTRPDAAAAPAPARSAPRLSRTAERLLLIFLGLALGLGFFLAQQGVGPAPQRLTQKDIDKAVLHTLATKDIPSAPARAAEKVAKSVVMVRGVESKDGDEREEGVGTGVVIVDSGIILTNLHVALAARQLKVEFYDGSVSDAVITGIQPQHDLAVLRAKTIPDDLPAATLRSTSDLKPGDHVVAVGFPFGIGPSVSSGVVSGMKREFRSPKGERVLTNLIQFDAAANPGNSGGPLVTLDGEVVGIVTAILNPTEQRVFIGIGFAVPIENAAAGVGVHPF